VPAGRGTFRFSEWLVAFAHAYVEEAGSIKDETPTITMPRRARRQRPNMSDPPEQQGKPATHRANEFAIHCMSSSENPTCADGGQGDIENGEVDREGEAGRQKNREDQALTGFPGAPPQEQWRQLARESA